MNTKHTPTPWFKAKKNTGFNINLEGNYLVVGEDGLVWSENHDTLKDAEDAAHIANETRNG